MPLYIQKKPNPQTILARCICESCPAGYEPSTEAQADAWVQEQLAAGWEPAPLPPEPPAPLSQSTDTALQRLTQAEKLALFTARRSDALVDYFLTRASSTGTISEADPEFPAAMEYLDEQGIIPALRWPELLGEEAPEPVVEEPESPTLLSRILSVFATTE